MGNFQSSNNVLVLNEPKQKDNENGKRCFETVEQCLTYLEDISANAIEKSIEIEILKITPLRLNLPVMNRNVDVHKLILKKPGDSLKRVNFLCCLRHLQSPTVKILELGQEFSNDKGIKRWCPNELQMNLYKVLIYHFPNIERIIYFTENGKRIEDSVKAFIRNDRDQDSKEYKDADDNDIKWEFKYEDWLSKIDDSAIKDTNSLSFCPEYNEQATRQFLGQGFQLAYKLASSDHMLTKLASYNGYDAPAKFTDNFKKLILYHVFNTEYIDSVVLSVNARGPKEGHLAFRLLYDGDGNNVHCGRFKLGINLASLSQKNLHRINRQGISWFLFFR